MQNKPRLTRVFVNDQLEEVIRINCSGYCTEDDRLAPKTSDDHAIAGALRRLADYEDAEERGRLVVLNRSRKPLVRSGRKYNEVICPYCGEDLTEICRRVSRRYTVIVNCPYCGEYIDTTMTVYREPIPNAEKGNEP